MKKSDITKLDKIKQELARISQNLPNSLTKELFSSELFLCRSEKIGDYREEIIENLIKISSMSLKSEQCHWLSERVEQQMQAFIQASMRNQKTASKANSRLLSSPTTQRTHSSLHDLHVELAEHHNYERRLQENLREAQQKAVAGTGTHDVIIKCQQRLLRCQRAITAIERKIEGK